MSRPAPQRRAPHQRYSGRDLSRVLHRIRADHGEGATIAGVNKVRSGGIGGFFAREEYEVIVVGDTGWTALDLRELGDDERGEPGGDPPPSEGPAPKPLAEPEETGADRFRALLEQRLAETDTAGVVDGHRPSPPTPSPSPPSPPPALLPPSAEDRGPVEGTPDPRHALEPPPPPGPRASMEAAGATTAPEEPVAPTESIEGEPGTGASAVDPDELRPAAGATTASEEPVAPIEPIEGEPGTGAVAVDPDELRPAAGAVAPPSVAEASFWARLARARADTEHLRLPAAAVVGVLGPLDVTAPIVRHLQRQRWAGGADVVVLSPRAEIVSEPSWRLVRHGGHLLDAAAAGGEALVVIDAPTELPIWVPPLVTRLRASGMGLLHYGITADPADEELAEARAVLGEPLAVHVTRRLRPERAIELIDRGEPIVTIGTMPVGPEMVVALRREVGRER